MLLKIRETCMEKCMRESKNKSLEELEKCIDECVRELLG